MFYSDLSKRRWASPSLMVQPTYLPVKLHTAKICDAVCTPCWELACSANGDLRSGWGQHKPCGDACQSSSQFPSRPAFFSTTDKLAFNVSSHVQKNNHEHFAWVIKQKQWRTTCICNSAILDKTLRTGPHISLHCLKLCFSMEEAHTINCKSLHDKPQNEEPPSGNQACVNQPEQVKTIMK